MLKVAYKYRQKKPDKAKRRQEAIDAKRNFPAKIPVNHPAKLVASLSMITPYHPLTPQLVLGRANRSELEDLDADRYLFPANTNGKSTC